jgi:hypothetical protein
VSNARVKIALAAEIAGALTVVAAAVATGDRKIKEVLSGYEEVPALSTPGSGEFRAFVSKSGQRIHYQLRYGDLESAVTQAHIHFENATNNGAIVVFLCSNLGNGPVGTQACPASGGTITGTIRPADVTGGAADQGIAAGGFDELVRAMKAGATYVNVHSVDRPGGEIRGQLDGNHRRH